jgi:hypothetical protein
MSAPPRREAGKWLPPIQASIEKTGNLNIKSPPADMFFPDFDFITFIEKQEISPKPGKDATFRPLV